MSADNGIYIGWFGDKEFRVIYASAIDSLYYPDGENAIEIVNYFKDAAVFDTFSDALKEALRMENEDLKEDGFFILEYGISTLRFLKPFSEYVKDAEEQKKQEQKTEREDKRRYAEGQQVTIHSLGPSYPDKEYRAVVRGLSVDGVAKIYILELVDKIDSKSYEYSHCTMPEACLRSGW